jgi:hypothetical protein
MEPIGDRTGHAISAGSSLIFSISEQKNTLIMVDGKVTGKNSGFNQFVTEGTHD